MDPYKKFVGFYTRSQDAFVNYSLVLDAAMSFELQEYGDLTEEECVSILFLCVVWCIIFYVRFLYENHEQLKVYRALRKGLSQFSTDFSEFQKEPEELEGFAKQVSFTFLRS